MVRRPGVEGAVLVQAQPGQAQYRQGCGYGVVLEGGAKVLEELAAIALGIGQDPVDHLARAQALFEGVHQIADVLALGVDFLLEQVRVFVRFMFEGSGHGSFLFSVSLSCCMACKVRSGARCVGSNRFLPDCNMMNPITKVTAPTIRAASQGSSTVAKA